MILFKKDLSDLQKVTFITVLMLCILCICWEWFISPLRPHGSLMVLKALPLALLLPGLYAGNTDRLQLTTMVVLLYFFEGFARLFESGSNFVMAVLELLMCGVIFYCALKYLAPIKRSSKLKKSLQNHQ
ncbi:MAG: DUF2069 domain-containing protein [Betaproteobacteria bacterium]|jgi:uncharacterized membrane protein